MTSPEPPLRHKEAFRGAADIASDASIAADFDLVIDEQSALIVKSGCTLRRGVEIWLSGGASVHLGVGVKLDRGVRIVATNGSRVDIGSRTAIGLGSVLNGGDDIAIGEGCLISGYVYLQTSMHRFEAGTPIRDQGYDHAPVVLEDDVWLGAHVTVLPGSVLRRGTVVGSNATLRASTGENEVWAGVPARRLRKRS